MYEYPDYDDFYDDPSEFEMQIEEFKNSLKQSVSMEWIDKMNALEKENAELQEVKRNYEQIKRDYENKKNECERKAEDAIKKAEYNARYLRLKELMENVQYTFFIPNFTTILGKKCSKCDNDRFIHYKTPLGKEAKEKCDCGEPIKIMGFECLEVYELSLRNIGYKHINMWFKPHRSDDDNYYTLTYCLDNYKIVEDNATTEDFEKFDKNEKICFRTQEKCQEYCDWYNGKILGVNIADI